VRNGWKGEGAQATGKGRGEREEARNGEEGNRVTGRRGEGRERWEGEAQGDWSHTLESKVWETRGLPWFKGSGRGSDRCRTTTPISYAFKTVIPPPITRYRPRYPKRV
jgi:hypothetical protein